MNIGNRILSFLIGIVSLFPFWLIYVLSDILFILLYYVFRYRKSVVDENLSQAFPEKTTSERNKITKKFYKHLADMVLETIKMKAITAKEVRKRIRLNNPQEVYQYLDRKQSVIGVTGHYGNWELGIHSLSLMINNPVLIIYKPLTNKGFESIFNKIRSRFGAQMVPMKQTLRQILSHKDIPHVSIFLSDQTPAPSESNYYTPFLGQETLVFQGVEKIARSTNFPVVYCHINRLRRGYYECTFTTLCSEPKNADAHRITAKHVQFLENIIKQRPELWLWSHRRWKYKPIS
ncbi:lysophospholipid acyltransferase family protein [Olivibacter sp. SDN3]|uniref:lysophospholipid acyltransferase family protein n=1 Tax=Olivibacter sp. SDN3 TaxID=2764720 RepID=UPI0016515746|nr:lysophospholipid acyltransferase family protein [Olivibacter sp. SDN3]QNL48443.1 lysophospholipid acyltransferase family protein [Olivibacter sp. SDN3]